MIDDVIKQAMSMNSEFGDLKEQCEKLEISGESAAGAVKIKLNGNYDCLSVEIDENLLKVDTKPILEDLIRAAINNAHRKLNKERESVVQRFAMKHLASLNPLDMKNSL